MTFLFVLVAILGLAFLMVVHEGGHYLAARYFGMRVTRFSIGFGPAFYKKKPKGSSTTYQIAIIPFLAYVQIAGMNPFEEIDAKDKGSYANAQLHARIITIFAGPLANYLVASVLFFVAFIVGGQMVLTTAVDVVPGGAAASAQMQSGDKVVEISGAPISDWDQVRNLVADSAGKPLRIVVERSGQRVTLVVVPEAKGEKGEGRVGIMARTQSVPVSVGDAAVLAVEEPPRIVYGLVIGIVQMVVQRVKPELSGPVGIVNEMAKAVERGFAYYVSFVGGLSAYLAGFNLLPIPALDGGRLMFLGYEAATRKRPNAKVEAHVHAVGLIMLLTLVVAVTVFSDFARIGR
jgi:regulator of sigma E protease